MKKFLMIILSMLVLLSCINVSAAEERVLVGETAVQTEEGVTTVTAQLLNKPEGKSAVLVAAYMHPESGRILSVNVDACADVSLLEGDALSVTLEDKSAEGGVLSYNVWDSLAGNMSLLNNAPTVPHGLTAAANVSDAVISWEDAVDDYDESEDLKYNIYDDGMLLYENSRSLEYTAENLADGTFYNFEVCAVDSEGRESEVDTVEATTLTKNAAHTHDEYTQSPDMNFEFAGSLTENTRLYYVAKAQAGGLDCYETTTRHNGAPTYLTYKFADDYFAELEGTKAIALELTYFDDGDELIKIDVHLAKKSGGSMDREVTIRKTNTGAWKTARKIFTLPADTYFAYNDDLGNGHYTFRMKSEQPSVGLKARDFKVYPLVDTTDKTDEYYTLKNNAGSYFTADGGTLVCDLTTNMAGLTVEEFSDRTGIKLSSVNNEATFKVTDSELMAGNVKVLVTYYAVSDDATVALNGEEKAVTASGKWQKMAFDVTDIGSGINTITSSEDIAINAIRVIAAD